jgi:hypothetical protein
LFRGAPSGVAGEIPRQWSALRPSVMGDITARAPTIASTSAGRSRGTVWPEQGRGLESARAADRREVPGSSIVEAARTHV